ncbi:MAG: hypothetical protein GXO19_00395 [Epsilonproteobacteria bacterium]|nr:hypothetical protein [Campylobacterota bacterium]NPA56171.1 hypothetical protein [Campylobacterota bacterium]
MRAEFKEDCKYGDEIREDTRDLFEKWLKRYGLDIPEMDEDIAAQLILTEMRKELDRLQEEYCGGICDLEPPSCER